MEIILIVAVGQQMQIGIGGELPWRVSGDLKQFKRRTMNHTVIVGRKTWESLPPLKGRHVVVVSRQAALNLKEGQTHVKGLEEAIEVARSRGETHCFIAGGAQIYREGLLLANSLELSRIDYNGEADTWFPEVSYNEWDFISSESFNDDPTPWALETYRKRPL